VEIPPHHSKMVGWSVVIKITPPHYSKRSGEKKLPWSRPRSKMLPNGDVFEKVTIFETQEVVYRRFETHQKFYLSFADFSIEHVASIFVRLRHFFLQFQSPVECLKSLKA
jgi:hypothetical protein